MSFDWKREVEILSSLYPRYAPAGKAPSNNGYASCFQLPNGRQIAVNTKGNEAQVWIQAVPGFSPFEGVEIRNSKSPGQPYGPWQTRKSSLNATTAPNLKGPQGGRAGMPAYCLNISDEGAFRKLLDWYASA
jgi:hypothetical protein